MDINTNSTQITISPEIQGFLEALIDQAKMVSIDENMRQQLVAELYKRLDNFLTAKLVDHIPPENFNQFIKLNQEGKSQEEVNQFLKNTVPNAELVFANAFNEFRDLYLGSIEVERYSTTNQKN